ncbi:hypothetical protein EMIT0P12_10282 [Pseudomonas sp. IT-P12]
MFIQETFIGLSGSVPAQAARAIQSMEEGSVDLAVLEGMIVVLRGKIAFKYPRILTTRAINAALGR